MHAAFENEEDEKLELPSLKPLLTGCFHQRIFNTRGGGKGRHTDELDHGVVLGSSNVLPVFGDHCLQLSFMTIT